MSVPETVPDAHLTQTEAVPAVPEIAAAVDSARPPLTVLVRTSAVVFPSGATIVSGVGAVTLVRVQAALSKASERMQRFVPASSISRPAGSTRGRFAV